MSFTTTAGTYHLHAFVVGDDGAFGAGPDDSVRGYTAVGMISASGQLTGELGRSCSGVRGGRGSGGAGFGDSSQSSYSGHTSCEGCAHGGATCATGFTPGQHGYE